MRREVKITGNHMLDPTKTHNLMIYLFMDIKMHVSLRSFCEIVVKVKCIHRTLYMNARERCSETRAPSNCVNGTFIVLIFRLFATAYSLDTNNVGAKTHTTMC